MSQGNEAQRLDGWGRVTMRGNSGAAAATPESAAFAHQTVTLTGATLLADSSGALWWPSERTLIVADLHLEKASAHARRGIMLPPYDSRDTLDRLDAVIGRWRPRTVIALGDSLHDIAARQRMMPETAATIARLQRQRAWIWITGNHDPAIAPDLGGEVCAEAQIGGLELRHEPLATATGTEIAGHLHPAARVALKGSVLRRRCFVCDDRRLVLPAFGTFTGGLNVLDEAFAPLIEPSQRRIYMLGGSGVYPIDNTILQPD